MSLWNEQSRSIVFALVATIVVCIPAYFSKKLTVQDCYPWLGAFLLIALGRLAFLDRWLLVMSLSLIGIPIGLILIASRSMTSGDWMQVVGWSAIALFPCAVFIIILTIVRDVWR